MQAKFTRLLFFTILTFLFSIQSKATHIVGGEMTYTCLGNNEYEIELRIFRDCYNGNPYFDGIAKIGIYRAIDTLLFDSLFITFDTLRDDTLNPILYDSCLVIPPDVCVHTTFYIDTVTLPVTPGGYQLIYQRCCRNGTIANIIAPLNTGATFGVNISEKALSECNSSAKFTQWPPIYICADAPIIFDQSAIDIDGDSIVYRLCTPFDGATFDAPQPFPSGQTIPNPVVWVDPPYNLSNVLGGVPLAIDEQTGLLTGTPNTIGQFVVGICLDEYRDGVFISSTRRDFQYNVGICGVATSIIFAPEVQCQNFEVEFINGSVYADEFLWFFNYPDDLSATSMLTNPIYTYPDTGVYTVMLIVEPNNPLCRDTSFQDIYLQYPTLTAEYDYELIGCTDVIIIEVLDLSIDTFSTIVSWAWELWSAQGMLLGTSAEQNPTFTVSINTIVTLELIVTSENGCEDFLSQSFPIQIFSSDIIPDQMIACLGDSVELNPDPYLNATYVWTPSEGLSDPFSPNPLAFPDTTTIYSVYLINDFNCEIWDTMQLIIIDEIPFLDGFADPDTIYRGQSSQLISTDSAEYIYDWFPSESLDDPTIFNPVATPEETTDYTLIVTDLNGCTNSVILRVVVEELECVEPNIFLPNAFTPNNDGENDVLRLLGNTIDEMYLAIYNRWGQKVFETDDLSVGWDGTFKGEALPPDVYGFYLKVLCINGDEFFKKGNIALLK
jgi:gliding motility-associated-like protein